jgi:hypothetical protein
MAAAEVKLEGAAAVRSPSRFAASWLASRVCAEKDWGKLPQYVSVSGVQQGKSRMRGCTTIGNCHIQGELRIKQISDFQG